MIDTDTSYFRLQLFCDTAKFRVKIFLKFARVIAETAPFIRTIRLAKKYRGIYAYEKFSKRVIGDEESRRRSRGATGSEKIKRSVGTRAAEEAAREEREKIDAMYPGVWDGLEWNG